MVLDSDLLELLEARPDRSAASQLAMVLGVAVVVAVASYRIRRALMLGE